MVSFCLQFQIGELPFCAVKMNVLLNAAIKIETMASSAEILRRENF